MHKCDDCDYQAKTSQGLSSHRRNRHKTVATDATPMVAAMERTLKELDRMRRLEEVDAARVQALRSISIALDIQPFNSQMWRELRESLNEVMKADDDADDGVARALADIASAAPMGNTSTS